MNYKKVKSEIRKFVDERDWEQFHTPKNLSMALYMPKQNQFLDNLQ